MSQWVYLSSAIAVTTAQEATPVSLRIQVSAAMVKALHNRWPQAYRKDDVRLVRRTTGLIALLGHLVPVAGLCERWGLSASGLYDWQQAVLLPGLDRWVSPQGGGRPETLTPKQKKRLVELLEAGPLAGGCETAGWDAVRIRVRIWRACGVLSTRPDGCTVRPNLGVSFQQARVVSDHLDAATRVAWLQAKWPAM